MERSIKIETDRIRLGREHHVDMCAGTPCNTVAVLLLAELIEEVYRPTPSEIEALRARVAHESATIAHDDGLRQRLGLDLYVAPEGDLPECRAYRRNALALDAALSVVETVRRLCTKASRGSAADRLDRIGRAA